jgi:hypothetical protein
LNALTRLFILTAFLAVTFFSTAVRAADFSPIATTNTGELSEYSSLTLDTWAVGSSGVVPPTAYGIYGGDTATVSAHWFAINGPTNVLASCSASLSLSGPATINVSFAVTSKVDFDVLDSNNYTFVYSSPMTGFISPGDSISAEVYTTVYSTNGYGYLSDSRSIYTLGTDQSGSFATTPYYDTGGPLSPGVSGHDLATALVSIGLTIYHTAGDLPSYIELGDPGSGVPAPEPATFTLFGSAILLLGGFRWRQRRRALAIRADR